jgi:hypothetical protein
MIAAETYASAAVDALVDGFLSLTLPKEQFTHAAHLTVALHQVRRYGRAEAMLRLSAAIPRYNAAVGGSPTAYHDTITVAWIAVIGRFLDEHDRGQPLGELAALLTATHGKFHLDRHYTRERLLSDEARRAFVEPDLAPL